MTRLIIDNGSTKAEWNLLEEDSVVNFGIENGFNPNYSALNNDSSTTLDDIINNIDNKSVNEVYYYGSGCGIEENCKVVHDIIKSHIPDARIMVYPDTLAACHALFGDKSGIACILGTGSNASLYDGKKIIKNAISLGYLLGDEGSGNNIGKTLIRDFFYGKMPNDIHQRFEEQYHLDRTLLINNLYHQQQVSKYLASFSAFADANQEHTYIKDICNQCFRMFIETYILSLNSSNQEIGFVGSVAYHFKAILEEALKTFDLRMGNVLEKPMSGLINYYKLK